MECQLNELRNEFYDRIYSGDEPLTEDMARAGNMGHISGDRGQEGFMTNASR
jgi:hypothetical protein